MICPTSKAKTAHACHAQIARRANLPHARGVVERPKSTAHLRRPASARGALRDRHECWKRDAMDASGVARRAIVLASAKPCGSDVPRLTSSLWNHLQVTETTKPGLREERGISRQTIAQGRPDVAAYLW